MSDVAQDREAAIRIGGLLCGHNSTKGVAKIALDQLASSIDRFGVRAVRFLSERASEEMLSFGPFCARVLLENSCAAIVGRLDSFRMLYLSEFHAQPEYDHGKRAKSAFAWTGDVLPEDKAAAEKATSPMWSLDYDLPKISRALFSRYFDHIYWKPAVEGLQDFLSSQPADPLFAELLAIEADKYISQCKGRGAQIYSTLSKGVHWEFFTSAIIFDEVTVKTHLRDTCVLVGQLGLVSHFIPTAYASLEYREALDSYLVFRRSLS